MEMGEIGREGMYHRMDKFVKKFQRIGLKSVKMYNYTLADLNLAVGTSEQ